jgi:hypothetical protein
MHARVAHAQLDILHYIGDARGTTLRVGPLVRA